MQIPSKPSEIEKDEGSADNNWADDQKERGYYYDDSHGYEQFDPEADEEPDEIKSAESETED